MPKKPAKNRPPFLQKEFGEPYASLTRVNVGSFLNTYKKKHGQIHETRTMLPLFLQYLSQKRSELKDLRAGDINTKDKTTKGIYDILRAKIDARRRKPKASPKQETSYLEYTPYEHDQTFQKRPRGHGESVEIYKPPELEVAMDQVKEPTQTPTPHPVPSQPIAAKAPKQDQMHQARSN